MDPLTDDDLHGDLDVRGVISIVGAGTDLTTLDAQSVDRIFEVHPGAILSLQHLRLTGGLTVDAGGAIRVDGGQLAIHDVVIDGNEASVGGAIAADGEVRLTQVSLVGNQADIGGAIAITGGQTTVANSTLFDNEAVIRGGAVDIAPAGQASLHLVTLSGNRSADSAAVVNDGSLSLWSTVIAQNDSSGSSSPDLLGTVTSDGFNFVGIGDVHQTLLHSVDTDGRRHPSITVQTTIATPPAPFAAEIEGHVVTVTAVRGNQWVFGENSRDEIEALNFQHGQTVRIDGLWKQDSVGTVDALLNAGLLAAEVLASGHTILSPASDSPLVDAGPLAEGTSYVVDQIGKSRYVDLDIDDRSQADIGAIELEDWISIGPESVVHFESDTGQTQTYQFEVTRSDTSEELTVKYRVRGSGAHAANRADFVDDRYPDGEVHFDVGQSVATIVVGILGEEIVEENQEFTVLLTETSRPLTFQQIAATGVIVNDDHASVQVLADNIEEGTDDVNVDGDESTEVLFTLRLDGEVEGGFDLAYHTQYLATNQNITGDTEGDLRFSGFDGETHIVRLEVPADDEREVDSQLDLVTRRGTHVPDDIHRAVSFGKRRIKILDDDGFGSLITDLLTQLGLGPYPFGTVPNAGGSGSLGDAGDTASNEFSLTEFESRIPHRDGARLDSPGGEILNSEGQGFYKQVRFDFGPYPASPIDKDDPPPSTDVLWHVQYSLLDFDYFRYERQLIESGYFERFSTYVDPAEIVVDDSFSLPSLLVELTIGPEYYQPGSPEFEFWLETVRTEIKQRAELDRFIADVFPVFDSVVGDIANGSGTVTQQQQETIDAMIELMEALIILRSDLYFGGLSTPPARPLDEDDDTTPGGGSVPDDGFAYATLPSWVTHENQAITGGFNSAAQSASDFEISHTETLTFNPIAKYELPDDVRLDEFDTVRYVVKAADGSWVSQYDTPLSEITGDVADTDPIESIVVNDDGTISYAPHSDQIRPLLRPRQDAHGHVYQYDLVRNIEIAIGIFNTSDELTRLFDATSVPVRVTDRLPVLLGDRIHSPDPQNGHLYGDSTIRIAFDATTRVDVGQMLSDPDGDPIRILGVTQPNESTLTYRDGSILIPLGSRQSASNQSLGGTTVFGLGGSSQYTTWGPSVDQSLRILPLGDRFLDIHNPLTESIVSPSHASGKRWRNIDNANQRPLHVLISDGRFDENGAPIVRIVELNLRPETDRSNRESGVTQESRPWIQIANPPLPDRHDLPRAADYPAPPASPPGSNDPPVPRAG